MDTSLWIHSVLHYAGCSILGNLVSTNYFKLVTIANLPEYIQYTTDKTWIFLHWNSTIRDNRVLTLTSHPRPHPLAVAHTHCLGKAVRLVSQVTLIHQLRAHLIVPLPGNPVVFGMVDFRWVFASVCIMTQ